ncbi:hypothetical protein THARTR1_09848 [Trichoderma harzianum]|uniref:Uncharacterized protein n=1 Tax=Trichoderma harzianum TaxID=5544 RepID=A0A2K0TVK9_TRIHA|nr:hypothetical protein THARTR1_09848 [Trichoderma harzianum]
MMPDPSAIPACSILVKGTWPGYLGGGRLSAEKLRVVRLAAGLVAVEERQIACREGDDGVVGVGVSDGDDARAGALEAAARSPDRALANGASISVFCRRASAAGCGALRAAENSPSYSHRCLPDEGGGNKANKTITESARLWCSGTPLSASLWSRTPPNANSPSSVAAASCDFKRGIRGARQCVPLDSLSENSRPAKTTQGINRDGRGWIEDQILGRSDDCRPRN